MSTSDIILLVLFILCVIASAFFAVAEIAFGALQRYKLERMLETKVKGAEDVAAVINRPERMLSTILLGNNIVNTSAATIGVILAMKFWGNYNGPVISIIVVTILILIFGETVPKTAAAHHAETLAVRIVKSLKLISWLFYPAVTVLSWIAIAFGKLFGAHTVSGSLISAEEIRAMITVGTRDGTVEKSEAEMLHKVFEFGDRPAREIMVPRTEVIWIEKGSTIGDFFKLYTERPLNRYPVFHKKRDNVVGIISAKDILVALAKGTCDVDRSIDYLIRPAYFAPEGKRISDILREMQSKNYHMSIVVDEYGGTAGVITLTSIVEEIIGEVKDELSTTENDYEIIDDFTFQIDASMRIEEVNEEMHLGLPEGDYETVAGFILKLLGHIPKPGDQIKYRGLKIVVTRMDFCKIEEILVTKEKHAAITDKIHPRTGN